MSEEVSAFREDALADLDATGVADLVARGDVSVKEVAEAAIARLEAVNPVLNAVAARNFERALAADALATDGLLHGVPTCVKDTDEVAGLPCTVGSRALSDAPSGKSSEFVEQLVATGVNVIATSTTPEFGLTGTTESLRFGATRNPWSPAHSTGGSSGGSSALVAAGVVPIAHANDGAGSIRIPAACCGLVGLKPTQGRLATLRLPPLMPAQIIHQGVVTRSVRDTALFYRAVEQRYRNPALPEIGLVGHPGRERLRIGVFHDRPGGADVDSQCVAATLEAASLCERLGHTVEVVSNPTPPELTDRFMLFWAAMPASLRIAARWALGKELERERLEPWANHLARLFWRRLARLPASYLFLKRFGASYDALFGSFDVFLSPTLGRPTPPIGYLGPEVDPETHMQRVLDLIPFTPPQNVSGSPAISLPLATSREGLPIGIQLAAPHGQDARLLRLALELEEAAPWRFPGRPREAGQA